MAIDLNTATTVIAFLMVFFRTHRTVTPRPYLKLDELIRAVKGARNHLVDLEKTDKLDLKKLEQTR